MASWFQKMAANVQHGVQQSVAHPRMLLGDIVNAANLPLSVAAKGVGAGLVGLGQATHNVGLARAGTSVQRVSREVNIALEQDPRAAGTILAGVGVAATGIVTGAGFAAGGALLAKGTADLVKDVTKEEAQFQANASAAQKGEVLGVAGAGTGFGVLGGGPADGPGVVVATPQAGSPAWKLQQAAAAAATPAQAAPAVVTVPAPRKLPGWVPLAAGAVVIFLVLKE